MANQEPSKYQIPLSDLENAARVNLDETVEDQPTMDQEEFRRSNQETIERWEFLGRAMG